MDKPQNRILNMYWGLIMNLRETWKLDLIDRLSKSIKENSANEANKMELSFGAWEGNESASGIIQNLRENRCTDRQLEEF